MHTQKYIFNFNLKLTVSLLFPKQVAKTNLKTKLLLAIHQQCVWLNNYNKKFQIFTSFPQTTVVVYSHYNTKLEKSARVYFRQKKRVTKRYKRCPGNMIKYASVILISSPRHWTVNTTKMAELTRIRRKVKAHHHRNKRRRSYIKTTRANYK